MKIVYIEWIDTAQTEQYHKDVAIPKGQGLGLQMSYSAGEVVEETEDYISLALTMTENGWYRDIVNIPKINIKSQKVLQE